MINSFCEKDPDIVTQLREFKVQFAEFCTQMASGCQKSGFGFVRTKDAAKIVVKFDIIGSVAKVNELVAIRNIVALHLRLRKHALYLSQVECEVMTEATFLCPLFVAEAAFPLSEEQERSLSQCGVLQVSCGGYSFFSPAWSGDKEVY